MVAPLPPNEMERLVALNSYRIMDTVADKQFDDLVALAAQICGTPMALISLVDESRQWFKARYGLDVAQTPRDISACQYVILQDDVMVVPDTHIDIRFAGTPLVTGDPKMRFYAGAPLATEFGHSLGTICVLDTKPRDLNEEQKKALKVLSKQVVCLMELRRAASGSIQREEQLLAVRQMEAATLKRIGSSLDSGTIIGTWAWDVKSDIVTGDERFVRTFNLKAEEARNGIKIARALESIHPDDVSMVAPLIERAMKTGEPYRAQYRVLSYSDDDQWMWVEANGRAELDKNGDAVQFPGLLIDINDRKKLELKLASTEQRYSDLFNSINQGFSILDLIYDDRGQVVDYIFSEVNPAFETLTNLTDITGKKISELDICENTWFENYQRIAETGKPERFTHQAIELKKWFEVYAFRVGKPEDRRVAILFDDITNRKMMEMELADTQVCLFAARMAADVADSFKAEPPPADSIKRPLDELFPTY